MTTLTVTLVSINGRPMPPLLITVVVGEDSHPALDISPDLCYTGITS